MHLWTLLADLREPREVETASKTICALVRMTRHLCRPAERLLKAIGDRMVDTAQDPPGPHFMNRTIKIYPAFADDFFGMEDTIERSSGSSAMPRRPRGAQAGALPVGRSRRKSSLAERLKQLMEKEPVYALKAGNISARFSKARWPVRPLTFGEEIEKRYASRTALTAPSRRGRSTPREFGGDITKFTVVRMQPSRLKQICVAKTEPRREQPGRRQPLGKVDIRN